MKFKIVSDSIDHISQEAIASSATSLVPKNSILMVVRSGILARTVPLAIAGRDLTINQDLKALCPSNAVDVRFLFHLLDSKMHTLLSMVSRGATVHRLMTEQLRSLECILPPLPEQHRIVAILDDACEGIATAKASTLRNLQNARALFGGRLESVFSQRGEGWVVEQIGSSCEVRHGFAFDGAKLSSDGPQDNLVVITPGNFTEDGRLLFSEKNTKRLSGEPPPGFIFDVGDLAVVMTDLSPKMKILGKPAFIETDNVLHNQRIGRFAFLNAHIEKRFLYYFMMTASYLKHIRGSATGTMVKHTAPKRILSNWIPYPPDRERQRTIIGNLDALRQETQRLEAVHQQKLAKLEALRQSLLQQAFAGNL